MLHDALGNAEVENPENVGAGGDEEELITLMPGDVPVDQPAGQLLPARSAGRAKPVAGATGAQEDRPRKAPGIEPESVVNSAVDICLNIECPFPRFDGSARLEDQIGRSGRLRGGRKNDETAVRPGDRAARDDDGASAPVGSDEIGEPRKHGAAGFGDAYPPDEPVPEDFAKQEPGCPAGRSDAIGRAGPGTAAGPRSDEGGGSAQIGRKVADAADHAGPKTFEKGEQLGTDAVSEESGRVVGRILQPSLVQRLEKGTQIRPRMSKEGAPETERRTVDHEAAAGADSRESLEGGSAQKAHQNGLRLVIGGVAKRDGIQPFLACDPGEGGQPAGPRGSFAGKRAGFIPGSRESHAAKRQAMGFGEDAHPVRLGCTFGAPSMVDMDHRERAAARLLERQQKT